MAIKMDLDSIVSATDVVKNFSKIRQQAKNGNNLIVLKNNKPDLAVLDIDAYKNLVSMAEQFENMEINKLITQRYSNDDGSRYNLEEILDLRQQILETKSSDELAQA